MQSGELVRQPYAGVNFISPVRDYEFGYCTKKQLLKRLPDPDRMFKQPIPQTLKAGDLRSRVSRCVVCMRTPHPRMAPLGGGGSGAEEGSGRPQPQRLRYRG